MENQVLLSKIRKDISPNDEMFAGNESHYFDVGLSALECIKLAFLSAKRNDKDIKNILDLPCGHGRVLRALKAAFPGANITACDLNQDGVDFCSKVLGAKPLPSSKRPQDIQTHEKYDLIWCGSLFTHLDFPLWGEFFTFFQSVLNPEGILVFTTHGRILVDYISGNKNTYGLKPEKLRSLLDNYKQSGFSYVNYPHSVDYGISMSSASHVISLVEKHSDLRLLFCKERGWDNHQDVVAYGKGE
jgi:SAM-dependent methyltransferase